MTLLCCHSHIVIEPKDLITLISLGVLILGWIVNSRFNKRNEIAKELRAIRRPTLKSFLELYNILAKNPKALQDEATQRLVREITEEFELYGQNDEIALYEKFRKGVIDDSEERALEALNKLHTLVISRIRNELNIK